MARFGQEEIDNLVKVIKSEVLGSKHGKMTKEFEETFAARWGAKYAVAVNSAMSGLHCAVAAAGAGPGDEVVCDPIVQFGAAAVMYNNGVPVFADVDPYTYNMDPESLRSKITERTKAVICTHLFGLTCDMDPILEIAHRYNLTVIEDTAQALGAVYKGKFAGCIGDIGVFSFEQSKHITSGDGGICLTSDKSLADKISITKLIGWLPEVSSNVAERWKNGRLGWNYRITELASAVLLAQLNRVDKILDGHRSGPKAFFREIGDNKWMKPQKVAKDQVHSYWVFALRYEGDMHGLKFDDFKRVISEEKLQAAFGYTQVPASTIPLFKEVLAYGKGCPIHCPHYKGGVRYGQGTTPVAEDLLKRIMLINPSEENIEKMKRVIERLGK